MQSREVFDHAHVLAVLESFIHLDSEDSASSTTRRKRVQVGLVELLFANEELAQGTGLFHSSSPVTPACIINHDIMWKLEYGCSLNFSCQMSFTSFSVFSRACTSPKLASFELIPSSSPRLFHPGGVEDRYHESQSRGPPGLELEPEDEDREVTLPPEVYTDKDGISRPGVVYIFVEP